MRDAGGALNHRESSALLRWCMYYPRVKSQIPVDCVNTATITDLRDYVTAHTKGPFILSVVCPTMRCGGSTSVAIRDNPSQVILGHRIRQQRLRVLK